MKFARLVIVAFASTVLSICIAPTGCAQRGPAPEPLASSNAPGAARPAPTGQATQVPAAAGNAPTAAGGTDAARLPAAGSSAPNAAAAPQVAPPMANATRPPAGGPGGSDPQDSGYVVATIKGLPITMGQLQKPLVEAYGLNMLAKIAQLELATRFAQENKVVVTPQDVETETERYLATLFNEDRDPVLRKLHDELEKAEESKDAARIEQARNDLRRERDRLLDQLLAQQRVTRADFAMVMQLNTTLRKLAASTIEKDKIGDEALRTAFSHQYGEKVRVRHIALANMQEALEAKRRLGSGQSFQQVARDMSRNQQTAALGGELPPFSRETPGYPQEFKDVAFGLKQPGQVSDIVSADGGYHLIELEERIPPKAIKFEDVKDGVREFLYEKYLEAKVKDLRAELQREVAATLIIKEPGLKQQYDEQVNVATREDELRDKNDIRRELDRRRSLINERRGVPGGGDVADPLLPATSSAANGAGVQPAATTGPASPATRPAGAAPTVQPTVPPPAPTTVPATGK